MKKTTQTVKKALYPSIQWYEKLRQIQWYCKVWLTLKVCCCFLKPHTDPWALRYRFAFSFESVYVSPAMKQTVCSDDRGGQTTCLQILRGGVFFLLVCFLSLSGGTFAWAKSIQEDMLTGKLPKSSRRAAHDETQGILLTIDSATTDVNKGAAQKTKRTSKPREVAKPKVKAKTKIKALAPKKKQAAPAKPKLSVKAPAPPNHLDAAAKAWADKIAALEASGTDEALEALDDMAEAQPQSPAVHAARAKILVRQKDTVEALEAWKRALALDPQNEAYKSGLAKLNAILLH